MTRMAGNQTTDWLKSVVTTAVKKAYKTIVVPTGKRFLNDVFEETKNAILWKNEKPGGGYSDGYTNYRLLSSGPSTYTAPYVQSVTMTTQDHSLLNYEKCRARSEAEAIRILNMMYSKLRAEGQVTLAFYYQCFGERYSFTDEHWGWKSMAGADAELTSNGWRLILPKIEGLMA